MFAKTNKTDTRNKMKRGGGHAAPVYEHEHPHHVQYPTHDESAVEYLSWQEEARGRKANEAGGWRVGMKEGWSVVEDTPYK